MDNKNGCTFTLLPYLADTPITTSTTSCFYVNLTFLPLLNHEWYWAFPLNLIYTWWLQEDFSYTRLTRLSFLSLQQQTKTFFTNRCLVWRKSASRYQKLLVSEPCLISSRLTRLYKHKDIHTQVTNSGKIVPSLEQTWCLI